MKRKILNLIIALVILCGGFAFSACGDGHVGYQLVNLATDYRTYVGSIQNIKLGDTKNSNTITFNYDSYVSNGSSYLSNKINDTSANNPYAYINSYYNVIFDNSLTFVYNYIDICSNSTIQAPSSLRNETKASLDQFYNALKRTSGNVEAVADQIRQDKSLDIRLEGLNNLFDSYTDLYKSAFKLSNNLTDIYYNYAINDSNPNYSTVALDNYDSSKTLVLLKSRVRQHISEMTEKYFDMYINGSSISSAFVYSSSAVAGILSNFNKYSSVLFNVQDDIDNLSQDLNASQEKKNFLDLAISMHNYQTILDNSAAIYKQAANDIVYLKIKNNTDATQYEQYCVTIIENHAFVLENLNTIYKGMIDILGRV